MMLVPRKQHNYDVWGDLMDPFKDPFFRMPHDENKLMKTDIKELDNKYEIKIDLPGYEKENIKISIEDGALVINASVDKDVDESKGKYIRKERFVGSYSRSFYVGDSITEEDIKASFKNGTLTIDVPKKEEKEEPTESKYIPIDD